MGIIEVTDNFLEKDLINFLCIHFQSVPHYYGHGSYDNDNTKFYASNCNIQEPLYSFLCYKISKLFPYKINFIRMYINIQHCFMDGDFHTDDGDTTALLMISPTLEKNSGSFEIKENNKEIKIINFLQNRLITFPAKWEHKGCAPIEKRTPRITLAFKTEKIYK